MQNEELIQSLRSDAEWAHANEWETPITLGDHLDAAAAALERLTAERDAAVEDMTAVLKRDSDDICAYCKNRIECKKEQCEKYSSGVGDVDGNYPDWKWTCMDFDYGTCSLLADTPCNGCFDDDCSGFEWRGCTRSGAKHIEIEGVIPDGEDTDGQ
jgi:hypothetical protein